MTRGPSGFAVAAVAAVVALPAALPACGGSQTPADPSFCEDRDGLICAPGGFPFVVSAIAASDYCLDDQGRSCPATSIPPAGATTAHLSQPAPGKLCLAGTLAPEWGLAVVQLRFSALNEDQTKVTKTFDADARGITQVGFSIDSPPPGPGLGVAAGSTTTLEIKPGQTYFSHFRLATPPLLDEIRIRQPGPLVAPLANFTQMDPNGSPTFDTTALDYISIFVGDAGLDYDFCIHDFKFLDAAGNEVTP